MPLRFVPINDGSSAAPKNARAPNRAVYCEPSSLRDWFENAAKRHESLLDTERQQLATRIRSMRRSLARRFERAVQVRIAAISNDVAAQLALIEARALDGSHAKARLLLSEFLDTELARPLINEWLSRRAVTITRQVPGRFVELRAHPDHKLIVPDGCVSVLDESVPFGCIRLVGPSGEVFVDWRVTARRLG